VTVGPGVCGFQCVIEAERAEDRKVSLKITGSECEHIQHLSELLEDITLRDLFAPLSKNPVFIAAERTGCHPSCPVPVAILKAVEVAMGMALPREVRIRFK
jgi:hypothetical protein